jgi:lipopolysaccharide export system permease protein
MILIRYILKAHIGPFVFSVVTLAFIFILQLIMAYIDQIAGKGLSWYVIIEFISLRLAGIVTLAVPMSVLVSTLMAFGMLSANNEITALKSAGVSIYRIIFPVVASAVILTFFLIWFNNNVLPEANYRWASLARDIRMKKPTLTLEPGVFNKDIPDYCILVRKTFEHSNEMEYMTIYDYSDPKKNTVITAKRGDINFSSDYQKVIINLFDGEIHETMGPSFNDYKKIKFSKHRISIIEKNFGFERSNLGTFSRGDRELSSKAMGIIVDSLNKMNAQTMIDLKEYAKNQINGLLSGEGYDSIMKTYAAKNSSKMNTTERALSMFRTFYSQVFSGVARIEANNHSVDAYQVEIHKKYSIPAACIIFVLLGAPLGIMAKKGGFGVGASLSLGFFLLYWACLIGGEKLADRDLVSPFLGMWMANILLLIFGLYLVYKVVKESATINLDWLKIFIPKQYRSLEDRSKEYLSGKPNNK